MNGRDADMDEEMREHLRRLAEENVAGGMDRDQARRAARLKFGAIDAIQESARSGRRFAWVEDIARDVAYGARMLRKSPGFTAAAAITLALGIGACAAIFSVANAVLLRRPPFPEPERVRDARWSC